MHTLQLLSRDSNNLYVGTLILAGELDFIRLTVTATYEAVLDQPRRFRFHAPLQEVQIAFPSIRFSVGSLTFQGEVDGDQLSGSVSNGTDTGTFELYRVQHMTGGDYRHLIGHYHLPSEHEIAFSQDIRADQPVYFYADSDCLVRVYPLGSDRFLSERCEIISFSHGQGDAAQSLIWREGLGATSIAARLAWCSEEELRVTVNDHVLSGTLLLPLGDSPHPAVILCHLADTHHRDYYRIFAEPFVQQGIAAFIYDKRGWGDSTGTALFSEIAQLTEDAKAAFRLLQQHPAIRSDAVGMWGISNGAWVGALAAAQLGDAAFMIGVSLAGVTPARQELVRRTNVARDLGASPQAVALLAQLWERLFTFLVDGQWTSELETVLRTVYDDEELQHLPKHPDHAPELQPVPPKYPIEQIKAEWGGTWEEAAFDPVPVYASLRCPILCVWGERDTVVPVDESIHRVEQALLDANQAHFQLHTVPDATHKLYLASPEPTGILGETMHKYVHNVSLAPDVRKLMVDWAVSSIQSRV